MMRRRPSFANRRKFLAQAGGLAAVAAGAPFGIGGVDALAKGFDHDGRFGPRRRRRRRPRPRPIEPARQRRIQNPARGGAVSQKTAQRPAPHQWRRAACANAVGSFTKSLPHTMDGLVVPEAYAALRHAMSTADPADFDVIRAAAWRSCPIPSPRSRFRWTAPIRISPASACLRRSRAPRRPARWRNCTGSR